MDALTICNKALGWLGASPIASLDEESTVARLCNANYESLRRTVLEDVQWSFARSRMVLDTFEEPTGDDWGEKNRFPIPNPDEVLTIDEVYPNKTQTNQVEGWVIESSYIIANAKKLYVIYTKDVIDENAFSPSFVEALAARLAADLAIPIVQSRELQADMWGLYNSKIKTAAANDGSQGSREKIKSGRLTMVRAR